MRIISTIVQYIKNIFYTRSNKPKHTHITDGRKYLCEISFCLNETKEIDIYCQLPDVYASDIKGLNNNAMLVAEFLHLIHSGRLQKQTLSLIQEETEYNAEEKLFFDNIVFYLTLLDTEKNKSSKISANEPLIRPSRVFHK